MNFFNFLLTRQLVVNKTGDKTRANELGMLTSMSRKGNCWDNAVGESFFATLEKELLDDAAFASLDAARRALFEYIEGFYNIGGSEVQGLAAATAASNITTSQSVGFLIELQFPRSIVGSTAYSAPNNFSVDLAWEP